MGWLIELPPSREDLMDLVYRIIKSLVHWLNLSAQKSEQEEKIDPTIEDQIWCVVANVRPTRFYGEDAEVRSGTKHFAPGAKVHCFPQLWGDGYEQIKVVGRHRGSHKFVTMIIHSEWLENWRVKMIYSPEVIRRFEGKWDASDKSKERAEYIVDFMTKRQMST